MSNFQLDNKEEANKFRQQLTQAMKLDAFRDAGECLGFVKGVDTLFEEASNK